jgi:tetratricopeptide (TPR) repeat protein/predicted O-methyltransferase YrrM
MSLYLIDSLNECQQALDKIQEAPLDWQKTCRKIGNILQGMCLFEESALWHSLALEIEPNLAGIYSNLGSMYAREQKWSEAIVSYNKALELKPTYIEAYWSLAQIYGVLEDRSKSLDIYYQIGKLYATAKEWNQAINAFEHILSFHPDHAETYACLAQIHSVLGNKEAEANAWYQAVSLKDEKATGEIYYQVGKNLQEAGKLDEAIASFKQGIERDPKFLPPYYELGVIYLEKNDLAMAQKFYEKLLEQDPEQGRVYYQLGTIALRQQKYDKAIAYFRECIRLEPEFPWAYRDLVTIFMQQQKWEEAVVTCQGILALVTEYPWVYSQMGNALVKLGNIKQASMCFCKGGELRGWHQAPERNYQFSQDNFTFILPVWTEYLKELVGKPELQVLEVGSAEGMSSCWLLDRMLTDAAARLTCVDKDFPKVFGYNISQTTVDRKVNKLDGNSHQLLAALPKEFYDLIVLQDRIKETQHTKQNAFLAWNLLKVGGIIIFRAYGWKNPKHLDWQPKVGVDAFLETVKGKMEMLHCVPQSMQAIVRKTSN